MKYFIASPWKNKEDVQALSDALVAKGYEVYSYLQNGANRGTGLSIAEEMKMFTEALTRWNTDNRIRQVFETEMEGLKACDALILFGSVGHSSLIEAGIAFGLGKEVIIIGSIQKPEVFYLISNSLYPDTHSFLSSLK